MRIGPLEIGRRAQAATEPASTPTPHKAQGASGTINMSGYLLPDDERNPELRGRELLRTMERMLRTDPAVREAYLHTVMPVLNATWDIDPAGDEPLDLEIAEMVRRAYFDWCDSPFKQTLQLTLRYLAQGFQLFEVTEKIITADLTYAIPDSDTETTVPTRQFVTWARWEHRRADTVWKWNAAGGVLESVFQQAFKDNTFGNWEIPAENIALFVNEQEGDDFHGQSVLRAAYKPWKLKDLVERVMAMSIEAHGVGIRVGYAPSTAASDSSVVDELSDQLETLKVGDTNYLVFPGPKQSSGSTTGQAVDGYLFEIVTPPGGLPDFTPFLNYLRGDIKGAVLARFSELGHGHTGARATSDSQSQPWYATLHAIAGQITDVHNTQIQRLVDRNYPNVEQYPKLVARDIETKSLAEFAQANAQLMAAGAINADKAYRAYVRQGIDAPDEDETDDSENPDELTEPENDLPAPPAPAGPQADLPTV